MSATCKTGTLRALFHAYRGRVLLTYALFNIENALRLTQPMFLGWAVSELLVGSTTGIWMLLGHQLVYLILAGCRRAYDTRLYADMYAALALKFVIEQREQGVASSKIAARSTLARQVIDFFERDVPFLLNFVYSLVGALVLLACYDPILAPCCVALLVPAWFLSRTYGSKTREINTRLHDQMEREVEIIDVGTENEVIGHYRSIAAWRIRLSDAEARILALLELAALLPLSVALVRACSGHLLDAGQISAVVGYVLMFALGLINLPVLADQWGRLADICGRLSISKRIGFHPDLDA